MLALSCCRQHALLPPVVFCLQACRFGDGATAPLNALPEGQAGSPHLPPLPILHCLQWQVRFETFAPLNLYNFSATARNVMGWGAASNVVEFLAPNVSRPAALAARGCALKGQRVESRRS